MLDRLTEEHPCGVSPHPRGVDRNGEDCESKSRQPVSPHPRGVDRNVGCGWLDSRRRGLPSPEGSG